MHNDVGPSWHRAPVRAQSSRRGSFRYVAAGDQAARPKRDVLHLRHEICWVMENHLDIEGQDVFRISIENYQFREDGSIHIRSWWEMPEPDSDVAQAFGRIMAEYLPDGGTGPAVQ